jgi:predicted nuclease of predicted toxin-antitoxin system
MTKDADFAKLLEQYGAPPKVLWLTLGNTTNVRLREVLVRRWPRVVELLRGGERLVEIRD